MSILCRLLLTRLMLIMCSMSIVLVMSTTTMPTMPINFKNDKVVYIYKDEYIAMYEKVGNEAKIKIMF